MSIIKLQDRVPPVYPEGSRDFQLFCHLYDVIFNGIKHDIDGIEHLINTKDCRSNVLQLMQTKLGFFTEHQYTDEALRYVLQAFPLLVRKKGTLAAIEETVYLFLKTAKLETTIKIDIINDNPTEAQISDFGSYITDHSIMIGIESSIRDISLLKEVLKYIIPFGYNIFFYFIIQSTNYDNYTTAERLKYAIVGNDLNSQIKGSAISKLPSGTSYISYTIPSKVDYEPATAEEKAKMTYTQYPQWADVWNDSTTDYESQFAQRRLHAINTTEIVPQGFEGDEVPHTMIPVDSETGEIVENIFDTKTIVDTFEKESDN